VAGAAARTASEAVELAGHGAALSHT
jgi:hypothetical protein